MARGGNHDVAIVLNVDSRKFRCFEVTDKLFVFVCFIVQVTTANHASLMGVFSSNCLYGRRKSTLYKTLELFKRLVSSRTRVNINHKKARRTTHNTNVVVGIFTPPMFYLVSVRCGYSVPAQYCRMLANIFSIRVFTATCAHASLGKAVAGNYSPTCSSIPVCRAT